MMRLRIVAPKQGTGVVLSVDSETTYLIGRKPDVLKISAADHGAPARNALKPVAVDAARVSRNHALVWVEDGTVVVRDLRSRNGSRLSIPSGRGLKVAGTDEVVLELAPQGEAHVSLDRIPDAEWLADTPFRAAVLERIGAWLEQNGLRSTFRIETVDVGVEAPDEKTLRLADGTLLHAVCEATVSAHWIKAWESICAYVHEQNARYLREQGHDETFVCASPAFRRAHEAVCRAAERGLPLVLLGPTGTGKDVLARCYHNHSPRREKQFVALFCGQTPDEQQLSVEIFGARKGSYTGQNEDRIGAVESADGGTLFIDEIGDIPPGVQLMLLRFLESGEYRRLGDRWETKRRADARLVCATLKDLPAEVARHTFREDLWNRINVMVVRVPSLRDRPEDIVAFLRRRTLDNGVALFDALGPGCLDLLLAHHWSGNFRDLNKLVMRLPRSATPGRLTPAVCREAIAGSPAAEDKPVHTIGGPALDWNELTSRASRAFAATQEQPGTIAWKSLADYTEHFLKPLVVARACGVLDDETTTPAVIDAINFSEVARKLGMADGQRAKKYLQDYCATYRKV